MRRKVEFQAPKQEEPKTEVESEESPEATPEPPTEPAEQPTQSPIEPVAQPTRGYTGTTCPVCKLAQFYVPGGVRCPNEHYYLAVKSDDPPISEVQWKARQASSSAPNAPARKRLNGSSVAAAKPLPVQDELPLAAPVEVPPPAPAPKPVIAPTGDRSPVAPSPVVEARREKAASSVEELALGEGYDRIVERVFTVSPWETYEPLEKDLRLTGDAHRADYATLVDALDRCQDNSREAHRLFVSAKVSVARYEADAAVLLTDMRKQSLAALDAEKAAGQRSKQITEADIESRIASLFPDEWRALEDRRAKSKAMVSHLERLSELWKERSRDLRVMIENSR